MKQPVDIQQILTQTSNLNLAERVLARVRYELKNSIEPYPMLYLPLARLSPIVRDAKRAVMVGRDTQLTLEAFQGSGNTYALGLFKHLDLSIAHHSHAAAQVIASVRRNIPTLIIVREPDEAVLSFIARVKVLTLEQALREYSNFHHHILPYKDGIVVTNFSEFLQDPAQTVARLDRKFGTDFSSGLEVKHESAAENVKSWHKFNKAGSVHESDVPLPSEVRSERKELLREYLHSSSAQRHLERANEMYQVFAALSDN